MGLKVITANRLREGDVVYLTAGGGWSTRLADGLPADDADAEADLLAAAERAVSARLVVGPYAMAVDRVEGRLRPIGRREIIRAQGGPSAGSDTSRRNDRGARADVPI